jgi:hypothetical protein
MKADILIVSIVAGALAVVAVWAWILAILLPYVVGAGGGLDNYGSDQEWQVLLQFQLHYGGLVGFCCGALLGAGAAITRQLLRRTNHTF